MVEHLTRTRGMDDIVISPTQAMAVVKENGYSLIFRDGDFHIDPPDGLEKIGQEVHSLKGEMLSALALMNSVIKWAGNDSKKWSVFLKLVQLHWQPTLADTPGGTLVDWTGNRMSYSRGLQNASTPDISFYSRVVEDIEGKVPEALVREKEVASRLRRKVT